MDGQRDIVRKQFENMSTEYQVQFGNEQTLLGIGSSYVRFGEISVGFLWIVYQYLMPHFLLNTSYHLSIHSCHRELISTAQSIDPTYCDVHQQYAHVYFQQSKYIPFEEEMVKSLYCQFTMGQAMNNWNKYWKAVLHGGNNKVARERYDKYMARIQEEIAKNEKAEEKKMSSAGVKEEL